jgi:hypothetical protein
MKGLGKSAAVLAAVAAMTLSLVGCFLAAGVTSTPALSKGVITAKGSVFVNGVEYNDSAAAITIGDAANHTDADLKVGMVVEVKGSIEGGGKGVATEVLYAANLEGTIDASPAPNTATGVFYVFGHKIATDSTTVFDGVTGLSGLAAGDRVEVSGVADAAAGVLNASRVEKLSTTGEFKIRGVVSGLPGNPFTVTNDDGKTVQVNVTSGTLDPSIANGSTVIVHFAAWSNPFTVPADMVRLIKELKADDGEHTEVSGVVSGFAAGPPATFTVDGVSVSASGSLAAGVANGVRVEVQGTMTAGVLVADEVRVAQKSTIEAQGAVTGVGSTNLTVDGVVFAVTATTICRDERSAAVGQFGLANIAVSDFLQVRGYIDSSTGAVVAARVERLNGPGTTTLSAPVTAVVSNTLTMAGINVDISGLANKATLLAVGIGTRVVVSGTMSGVTFIATSGAVDN